MIVNSESLILLFLRAFETSSDTEFSFATAKVKIFSCLVTFFLSRLLTIVKPADNKPKTVATPASAGLATIPKPVKAVARVADDNPAERQPRPTAEMCAMECVFYFFWRPVCSGLFHFLVLFVGRRFF